jgi:hypothetical protein
LSSRNCLSRCLPFRPLWTAYIEVANQSPSTH